MGNDNLTLESRIKSLRNQLDTLGYHYEFSVDTVQLLELLVADLLQTTDTLRHYKTLSQNTLQACRDLEVYADSYREENSRLKLKLKHLRDSGDKENKPIDDELITKNEEQSENNVSGKKLTEENQNVKECCSALTEEIRDKEVRLQQYKDEIQHLRSLLQNKSCDRPVLRSINYNQHVADNELRELKKQNVDLKTKLERALIGQQEAKHNAVRISEKYRELEKMYKHCLPSEFLHDGDLVIKDVHSDAKMKKLEQEILKLKAQYEKLEMKEANDSLRCKQATIAHSEDYKYVQEIVDLKSLCRQLEKKNRELENELYEVKKLYENIKLTHAEVEKELSDQKRLCQEREADKDRLNKRLNRILEEMKMSVDRINRLKTIERDLTCEIDRLNYFIAVQRRHIFDLEEKVKELFITKEEKKSITGPTARKMYLDHRYKQQKKVDPTNRRPCKNKFTTSKNAKSSSEPSNSVDENSASTVTEAEQYLSTIRSKYEQEKKNAEIKRADEARKNFSSVPVPMNYNEIKNLSEKNNDVLIREKNRLLLQIETYKQEIQFLNDKILQLNEKNNALSDTINQRNNELEKKTFESNQVTSTRIVPYTVDEVKGQNCSYCYKLENALMECDNRVCKLETERAELLNKQCELNATVESSNQHVRQLRSEIHNLEIELQNANTDVFKLRTLYEQSKENAEFQLNCKNEVEFQLKLSLNKIDNLEHEKNVLQKEIAALQSEQNHLRQSLSDTSSRKELLLMTVDEKTQRLVALEKLLETKESQVKKLEQTISDLQRKFDRNKLSDTKNEETVQKLVRELDRLKARLKESEKKYENVMTEKKLLQSDLTALSRDYAICRSNTDKLNKEASDLRIQVHEYIEKVRTAEETLREKDAERSEMLEYFRTLTKEAKQLENNNHSLESEAHSTKSSLQSAENKIYELENILQTKDALISGYEEQLTALTQNIAHLEITVKDLTNSRNQIELDLISCRELCNQMDNHRDSLSHSVSDLSGVKQQLQDRCNELEQKVMRLEDQLSREKTKVTSLESRLKSAEQENKDCSTTVNELKDEIVGLRATIKCLEEALEQKNKKVRLQQAEYTDHHLQNVEYSRRLLNTQSERIQEYSNRNTL